MKCAATYNPGSMWGKGRETESLSCHREANEDGLHKGKHQAFETVVPPAPRAGDLLPPRHTEPWTRLWSWDSGGAHGSTDFNDPAGNCTGCGERALPRRVTHQPEDHGYRACDDCGAAYDAYRNAIRCDSCVYWRHRVAAYAGDVPADPRNLKARFVRVHPDSPSMDPVRFYAWSPGHGGAFGGMQVEIDFDDGSSVGPADYLWDNGEIPWWLRDQFPPNARASAGNKIARPGYVDPFGKPLTYTGHPAVRLSDVRKPGDEGETA